MRSAYCSFGHRICARIRDKTSENLAKKEEEKKSRVKAAVNVEYTAVAAVVVQMWKWNGVNRPRFIRTLVTNIQLIRNTKTDTHTHTHTNNKIITKKFIKIPIFIKRAVKNEQCAITIAFLVSSLAFTRRFYNYFVVSAYIVAP